MNYDKSDIHAEAKWRLGKIHDQACSLRETIDVNSSFVNQKKQKLDNLKGVRKKLTAEFNECKSDQSLLDQKQKLLDEQNILRENLMLHTERASQICTEMLEIQQQLTPKDLLNKVTDINSQINLIEKEITDIRSANLGDYQTVDVPGEYAEKMRQEVLDRDSYHREGFLFDFMLTNNINTRVVIGGERSFGYEGVCISQARTPGDDQVILYSDHNMFPQSKVDFLAGRHYNEKNIQSVPFLDKKPTIVWRGGDTGGQGPITGQKERGLDIKKISRREFIDKFKDSEHVDACIIDNKLGPTSEHYIGDPNWLTPIEQANKYKYQLYLEGNDAGSNPRWVFSTQCVVFAPDVFTSELTWHYHMKPWVNYIPFKHDLSDLEEKIVWAENNIEKCNEIIFNANEMHRKVTDVDREINILDRMFEIYTKNILL